MLTTWKQINTKYNVLLNSGKDGELSELEKRIYNGQFSQNDLNLGDVDTLLALSNYYMLTKNDQHRLIILNKLVEIGDHRGHANLGCYYFNVDRNLAISHFEKAMNMGNLNAKFNLAKHYIEIANLDKAQVLCDELAELGYVPVYMLLAQIAGWKGDSQKMIAALGKGIEENDENCLLSLEMTFNYDIKQVKHFLLSLSQNELIKTKLEQIENVLAGNGFILNVNRS